MRHPKDAFSDEMLNRDGRTRRCLLAPKKLKLEIELASEYDEEEEDEEEEEEDSETTSEEEEEEAESLTETEEEESIITAEEQDGNIEDRAAWYVRPDVDPAPEIGSTIDVRWMIDERTGEMEDLKVTVLEQIPNFYVLGTTDPVIVPVFKVQYHAFDGYKYHIFLDEFRVYSLDEKAIVSWFKNDE